MSVDEQLTGTLAFTQERHLDASSLDRVLDRRLTGVWVDIRCAERVRTALVAVVYVGVVELGIGASVEWCALVIEVLRSSRTVRVGLHALSLVLHLL